jgi:hypothetical protein
MNEKKVIITYIGVGIASFLGQITPSYLRKKLIIIEEH